MSERNEPLSAADAVCGILGPPSAANETDEMQAVLVDVLCAAEAVADSWEHDEIDKSDCPYNRRGFPGADPHGSCSYGCTTEPDCHTNGPYPLTALYLAVERLRKARA